MEKKFIQNGGEFKSVKAGELFTIKTNPQLNKDSFVFSEKAEYPYFTRTVLNNGIAGYVEYLNEENKIKGNSLAIGMLGMKFFYMEKDFYAGQFTKTAYPKSKKLKKFNRWIAQYFIAHLNKFQEIYQGGLVRDFERLFNESELILPYQKDELSLDFMENFVSELQASRLRELQASRLRELQTYLKVTGLADYQLSPEEQQVVAQFDDLLSKLGGVKPIKNNRLGGIEWASFNVVDIFDVKNTHSILSSSITPNSGKYPYVTAGESNNSISTYIDYDLSQIEKGNSIMIGGKTLIITYQEQDYFSNDSHNLALYIKDESGLNKDCQLFMVAALFKSLKPLYSWGNSISKKKIQNDVITLPMKNGEIDFDFMSTAIQAVKKLVIADVVKYADREMAAYRQVIQ